MKRQKLGPTCIVCGVLTAQRCPHCDEDYCGFHLAAHPAATLDALGHLSCARLVTCPHCAQQLCRQHSWLGHRAGFQNDAAGDSCCATALQQCTHCAQGFCSVHSWTTHQNAYQNDGAAHSCCAASLQQCTHCAKGFCNTHSWGTHQGGYQNDAAGHSCCAGSLKQCTHCTQRFCGTHSVHAEITAATCTHKTCAAAQATCAVCAKQYCQNCKATLMVRDLCKVDLTASAKTATVGNIHVKYEKVPGYKNTVERTTAVDGPIKSVSAGDRVTPPPPLCSGKTERADDIAELKQYDRGHLIALELDGADDKYLIVPMIRQFNQSGAWRQMETSLVALLGGKGLVDVDGNAVSAKTSSAVTNIDLSLRVPNTVNNTKWHLEVRIFYDDVLGDSRVPVWFYVRVLYNKKVWTHFSFANRCGKKKTLPEKDEQVEFHAAQAIYGTLNKTKRDLVVDKALKEAYTDDALDPVRPNQLLEFMRDVNIRAKSLNQQDVFTCMVIETQGKSKPYTDFQRKILRKFNRWKNGGALRSDVQNDGVFVGEKRDAHQTLDECGGRSAPEVDHINPGYQGGGNFYINARLVSFHHNHLYREKKTIGAKKVCDELYALYLVSTLAFSHEGEVRYMVRGKEFVIPTSMFRGTLLPGKEVKEGTKPAQQFLQEMFEDDVLFNDASVNRTYKITPSDQPYKDVKPMLTARQTFLKAADGTAQKYAAEKNLEPKYTASRNSHEAAVQDVIDNVNHPVRIEVVKLIKAATNLSNDQLPLCKPSDRLNLDKGGETGGVDDGTFTAVALNQAQSEKAYTDLVGRWDKVKPT